MELHSIIPHKVCTLCDTCGSILGGIYKRFPVQAGAGKGMSVSIGVVPLSNEVCTVALK